MAHLWVWELLYDNIIFSRESGRYAGEAKQPKIGIYNDILSRKYKFKIPWIIQSTQITLNKKLTELEIDYFQFYRKL